MRVPVNSGNRSGSCSENYGFRIAQVDVKCHSENGILHSENHLNAAKGGVWSRGCVAFDGFGGFDGFGAVSCQRQ